MSESEPLHTLNARGNIMLEVMRDHFKISPSRMHREIQAMRNMVVRALAAKGIDYGKLKSALVPDRKKKEAAFIFDTSVIANSWYGYEIFSKLIPLFDQKSNHSILVGDYIDKGAGQDRLYEELMTNLIENRQFKFVHSSQIFIVYINNLTPVMLKRFNAGLSPYRPYIGYVDTTYTSIFKFLLSTMLVNLCLKHGKVIIQGHEPDRLDSEDVNMSAYPFEESGYVCRSINGDLEGVFLSYKIERPVIKGFEVDTEFALTAVGAAALPLKDFSIQVDDAKINYIRKAKAGSIERAGLARITSYELAQVIKAKISASYIYNMAFDPTQNVTKFNIMLELGGPDDPQVKLLAALEYIPDHKILRLITLY